MLMLDAAAASFSLLLPYAGTFIVLTAKCSTRGREMIGRMIR